MSDAGGPGSAHRPTRLPGVVNRGRKSKILLGYDLHTGTWPMPREDQHLGPPAGRVLQAIKVGNRLVAAAEWAGISESALYDWMARGRDSDPGPSVDRNEVPVEDRPYVDFFRAVASAEAHAEVELVTLWRAQARTDWRAARDLLDRRFRQHGWSRTDRIEVTGTGGGPVQMAVITDPELARAIATNPRARDLACQLLAEIAPAAPPAKHDILDTTAEVVDLDEWGADPVAGADEELVDDDPVSMFDPDELVEIEPFDEDDEADGDEDDG